ncbi:hypothetical protein BC938DRAFT_479684, partial [Jimgerdemannia flammicorona]
MGFFLLLHSILVGIGISFPPEYKELSIIITTFAISIRPARLLLLPAIGHDRHCHAPEIISRVVRKQAKFDTEHKFQLQSRRNAPDRLIVGRYL